MNTVHLMIFCAATLGLSNFSCAQQEPYKKLIASYSYHSADIVNGEINYAKVLSGSQIVPLLEMTDEQLVQFKALSDRFFAERKQISEKRKAEIASQDLSKQQRIEALRQADERNVLVPIDVREELNKVLLPHQVEFIETYMPLRFIVNSLNLEKKGVAQKTTYAQGLGKLLGVDESEADQIVTKLKEVRAEFADEILQILYEEVESAINLLNSKQKQIASRLLKMDKKRSALLDASDIRSLISQRLAWKASRRSRVTISLRTAFQFTTSEERKWLELAPDQEKELNLFLRSTMQSPNGNGKSIKMSFKRYPNDQKKVVGETDRLNVLYESVSGVLLTQQIEELRVLDRWRLLKVRPLPFLLSTAEFKEKIPVEEMQRDEFLEEYNGLLDTTIKKLKEVQKEQYDQLASYLPTDWKEKFTKAAEDN